jgi:hypothetical protein
MTARQVMAIDQGQITRRASNMPRWVSVALGDIAGRDGTADDAGG